jgi:hypothetical protein
MNNGLLKNSAGLQKGGARQLVRRSLVRRPDPDLDALKNTVYRCAVSFVGACSQAMWGRLQAGSYRCSPTNPMCALLLFVVLAAFSSLHAQNTGIYVNSSNNVGIGTTSPLTTIDVAGTLRLDNPTTQANYFATLSPRYDSSHPFSLSVENNTGGTASEVLGIYSPGGGGSLNLAIGLHGNVGIGTTTPSQQLSVANTIAVTNYAGIQYILMGNQDSGGVNDPAVIESANGSLYFGHGSSWSGQGGTITQNVTFTQGGNVGIGISSPGALLTLKSDNSTQPFYVYDNSYNAVARITYNGQLLLRPNNSTDTVSINSNGNSFLNGGNVGIGTTSPQYPLDVAGQVHASSFVASSGNNYADFVFKPGYKLEPLSAVEASIKKDGHLPGIPSEAEATAHGIDLTSMQVKLLQKIEELTLHQIDEEKRIEQLEKENAELRESLTK